MRCLASQESAQLALTAAEKGQKHSAKGINPGDERGNEQSSMSRAWC